MEEVPFGVKHLIIGAGATYAEACELGVAADLRPPLMKNFARKTWRNYTPYPFLWSYLHELGYEDLGKDPRELFFQLEERGETNIERFLEYAWLNRDQKIELPTHERLENGYVPPGYISSATLHEGGAHKSGTPGPWPNLLYHGVGSALAESIVEAFFINGSGFPEFNLAKKAATWLGPGDLALSLNYDTVFEIALEQAQRPYVYAPEKANAAQIKVCKPHGSLNLVVNKERFMFGQPRWLGSPQPPGMESYICLVPPTLNKTYARHPIARHMVKSVKCRRPDEMAFWGLGFTESDADLFELFRLWARSVKTVDVINPDREVGPRIGSALNRPVRQYHNIDAWLTGTASAELVQ
jgi:hypothetical protein